MRKAIVVCFTIVMIPFLAKANPVPNGQCCFAHEYFKPDSSPPGGCLEVTTCSDIQSKGLFVRCYHKKANRSLRINGKRPSHKFSTQAMLVDGTPVDFNGSNYPMTKDTYSWKVNAEIIEGPKSRLKVRPIKAYCEGRMARQRPKMHNMNPITYRFRLGAFLRDYTGRTIETYRQGRFIRERETQLWTLPLAESDLVIKR